MLCCQHPLLDRAKRKLPDIEAGVRDRHAVPAQFRPSGSNAPPVRPGAARPGAPRRYPAQAAQSSFFARPTSRPP
jgi:hypothetical protein